jgi:hypothetical protein
MIAIPSTSVNSQTTMEFPKWMTMTKQRKVKHQQVTAGECCVEQKRTTAAAARKPATQQ